MGFLREFIRNPRQTGSIAASSPSLVRRILNGLPLASARTVVELGAGTGAFTAALARAVPASATVVAIEVNPTFAAQLRERFTGSPVRVANRSAAELSQILAEHKIKAVDVVLSALPWTLMTSDDQRVTLDAIAAALAPDAPFVTLTCLHQTLLPSGRRFHELLTNRFTTVQRGPVVWTAMPPMTAYRCFHPIRHRPTEIRVNQARH